MRFLITPDSYKESLSAYEAAKVMERAVKNIMPAAECDLAPMADGGEGTAECLMYAEAGDKISCTVKGPLGNSIETDYIWIEKKKKAIIEVAKACGIMLVPAGEKDPMLASTYGVGQLIREAVEKGCRDLVLTLGGTVTNDGGCGMLLALGAKILDQKGKGIPLGGRGLGRIASIDLEKPKELLKDVKVTVLCDVKSPLLGERGATYVFGPQKGVTGHLLHELEMGMENFAGVLNQVTGFNVAELKGAGAAGGLGCALYAITDAQYISGSKYVMQALGLDERIAKCDCIITGEGSIDAQSLEGKVPIGIAKIARQYNKPVVAFVGMANGNNKEFYEKGITAIFCIVRKVEPMDHILERAADNLQCTVENFIRVLDVEQKQNFNVR